MLVLLVYTPQICSLPCTLSMSPCLTKCPLAMSDKCPLSQQYPLVQQLSKDSNDILRNCVPPLQIDSIYSTPAPFSILIKRCITAQTTCHGNIWYLEPNFGNQMHHFLDLFAICINWYQVSSNSHLPNHCKPYWRWARKGQGLICSVKTLLEVHNDFSEFVVAPQYLPSF